jgi:ornithine carbamoyltransferase
MIRHFTELSDLGSGGVVAMLDAADRFKAERGKSSAQPLAGRTVGLVFEKASTRTFLSLDIAVAELGGHPVALNQNTSQMSRGEPIADTARVLSRMVHAITFRTSTHARLLEMVAHSSVPVLNALTDKAHPMQLLADLQTVRQIRGKLVGLKFAWVGDGNNMANSWIEAAGLLGLELTLACPDGYTPDAAEIARAGSRGGKIRLTTDAAEAAQGADVISTDVFASMGQEAEREARARAFAHMQVTQALVSKAAKDVVVLHCLPAHRGEEIAAEVIDGPRSFVWDQAEARLHTSKALFAWALGDSRS